MTIQTDGWTKVSLKAGDTFTRDGWMNIARPKELQVFRVLPDGFTCEPIYSKQDLAFIKKLNKRNMRR